MAQLETGSERFTIRCDEREAGDALIVLQMLEATRERLAGHFPDLPREVEVALHGSTAALDTALPLLGALRAASAPAARRYLVGWPGRDAIHVLTPRALEARASGVPESRQMLLLSPAALLAQLVASRGNELLRVSLGPRHARRSARWAWLAAGSGQYFSGQLAHARPAIARRLREGAPPDFPPGLRDATLLGGTVLDLLAREEGVAAAVAFTVEPPDRDPRAALLRAFHGRAPVHTEGTWRAHLARTSDPRSART